MKKGKVMAKKEYIQPVVELTQLMVNSIILVGSGNVDLGGGGGIDPD